MKSALPLLITTAASRALYLAGWEEAGLTDRVINSITPRIVRTVFYMHMSSQIPVIMLDIHHRRDAATLGAQRRGDFPTQPALLALGQLIGLVTRQQRPDNPGILIRDRYCRAVFTTALD